MTARLSDAERLAVLERRLEDLSATVEGLTAALTSAFAAAEATMPRPRRRHLRPVPPAEGQR